MSVTNVFAGNSFMHANLAILAGTCVFYTWAILRAQSCTSNKLRLV